jgi:hypothetical protein
MDQFHTNFDWTKTYLANNIEPSLYVIVNDNHKRHPEGFHGGPLLFMLFMQDLFFVAQKTASTLHSLPKQYRVPSVPGENIKAVTSTVVSISRRIWLYKKRTFPDDFLSMILSLFQTSSVPDFNEHFKPSTTDRRKEISDRRIREHLRFDNRTKSRRCFGGRTCLPDRIVVFEDTSVVSDSTGNSESISGTTESGSFSG